LVRKAISIVALAAAFTMAAAVLVPALLGYERYVITSGSMTGTYDRGSLLYAEEVPTRSLHVGDVITYSPPRRGGEGSLITHRIVLISRDRDGVLVFRTKGDANRAADPWHFSLERPTQARAAFALPYAGYALAALAVREMRMLLIGLPALLVALAVLARLWSQAGAEARRRRDAALAGTG
jgi:signal peptidase